MHNICDRGYVWFSLVSLFNGVSTFVGHLKPIAIGQMSRVFNNGPEDPGSIPGRVIPKTQKMVFDATKDQG